MTIKRPLPGNSECLAPAASGMVRRSAAASAAQGAGGPIDWYVAAVVPRKERFALANLHNQGFATFFPLLHRVRSPKGTASVSPLFPGYIFVGLDPQRIRWQSINGTFGIRYVVGPRGALPSAVPSAVMDELFQRFPQGAHYVPECRLRPGDPVNVTTGAFAGIPATFEDMLSQDRIRVLLSWLNTQVAVVMPKTCIDTAA